LDHDLDAEFPLGDGTAQTDAAVVCPYCGEEVAIGLDPGKDELHKRIAARAEKMLAGGMIDEVEALLANPAGRLKPGFFVQATIPSELQESALTVPEQSVNYRYGVYKVFVVNGAQVEEREIKTGPRLEGRVEVLEGLKAGDRVALAAEGELFSGAQVREVRE